MKVINVIGQLLLAAVVTALSFGICFLAFVISAGALQSLSGDSGSVGMILLSYAVFLGLYVFFRFCLRNDVPKRRFDLYFVYLPCLLSVVAYATLWIMDRANLLSDFFYGFWGTVLIVIMMYVYALTSITLFLKWAFLKMLNRVTPSGKASD